jgi:RNA polymerase sigma factor (sigma-70 family)
MEPRGNDSDRGRASAARFTEVCRNNRARLVDLAFGMLADIAEAEDVAQEAFARLLNTAPGEVRDETGWLVTVTTRLCLDQLRSARVRRVEPRADGPVAGDSSGASLASGPPRIDPADQVTLDDTVQHALLVVLQRLSPAERVAFVLHDMFGVSFEEIAPIVGRTPAAARQLASRARRGVRGASAEGSDLGRQRQLVDAFLAASRRGDFGALLTVLDPEVVVRADGAAVRMGAEAEVRGAAEVAETFSGRARAARPAVVDGAAALVWMVEGQPRMVFGFTIEDGKIAAIDLLADPERLGKLDVVLTGG